MLMRICLGLVHKYYDNETVLYYYGYRYYYPEVGKVD